MSTLCTQGQVQNILQTVFDNQPEPVISDLISRASAVVESYCNRTFEAETGLVETLDGNGHAILRLAKTPVTVITSIVEDGTTLTAADDFLFYPNGELVRGNGKSERLWTFYRQAVVITYDAGFSTLPEDLEHAVASIVARWFQVGAAYAAAPDNSGAVKSISLDGSDSIEYPDAVSDITADGKMGLTASDWLILNEWRRWVFV